MPTRTDESPPRQQDRAPGVSQSAHDEVRSFDTDVREKGANCDEGVSRIEDPDINTDGSER